MLARLAASAGIALALLFAAILIGSRFVGPGADPGGEPVGHSLDLNDVPVGAARSARGVDALRDFLGESPAARLDQALARSDVRWLGIGRLGWEVPGVNAAALGGDRQRVRPIPGTEGATTSDEHAELIERARRYAAAYNALLIRRAR